MIDEIEKDNHYLKEYSKNHNIYDISSEELMKLIEYPFSLESIRTAFNISEKEFNLIREKNGIKNIHLKSAIRDIDSILFYIDYSNQFGFITNKVRNTLLNVLIQTQPTNRPHHKFYLKELFKIDFSQKAVLEDIQKREIDVDYRLDQKKEELKFIEQIISKLIDEEKLIKEKSEFLEDDGEDISLEVDGREITYHVILSDEDYNPSSPQKREQKNKFRNGKKHHYMNEVKTKIDHGKIGEKLIREFEQKRLIKLGLSHLIDDVDIIAQIDDETTFDGTGYDLVSFDENGEKIFVEVKTSFSDKDVPFFITPKEINLMKGICEEYDCKKCFIYYVLVKKDCTVIVKRITSDQFQKFNLVPVLYKIEG